MDSEETLKQTARFERTMKSALNSWAESGVCRDMIYMTLNAPRQGFPGQWMSEVPG